jgi:hypothetical protein
LNTEQATALNNSSLVDPSRSFGSKLKSSLPWKIFVMAGVPIFNFIWAYVLHFNEKMLYLTSRHRGMGSQTLNKLAIEIIKDDPDYLSFARWLNSKIPKSVIDGAREKLLSDEKEGSFVSTLELALDDDTRFEMLKFALSNKVLNQVLDYFKVVPRIDTLFVILNIAKPQDKFPAGSQKWHRDGDIYKMISSYICLTDLDRESGRFSAVSEKNLSYHQTIPLQFYDPKKSIWQNGRHSDEYFSKFIPDSEQTHFEGPIGTAAFVDSATCYHKGGHCAERDRLLFSINFISDQIHDKVSIVDQLKLRHYPRINELLSSPLHRSLLRPNSIKKGTLVYGLARRLLNYYVSLQN